MPGSVFIAFFHYIIPLGCMEDLVHLDKPWLHGDIFGSGRYKQAGINKINWGNDGKSQFPFPAISLVYLFHLYQPDSNLAGMKDYHAFGWLRISQKGAEFILHYMS